MKGQASAPEKVTCAFKPSRCEACAASMHLLDRPFLRALRVAPDLRRRKAVEGLVEGRMNGDELALQMGRKFGDLDAVRGARCP